MNKKTGIGLISLLLLVVSSMAQPIQKLKEYKEKYKGEHVISLQDSKEIDISITKTGELEVYQTIVEERMLLNQKSASLYSSDKISYSHFYELDNINAYTLVPSTKKYKKINVKEFTTKDVLSNSVFYDDVKSKKFFFTALTEGAITHLDYRTKIIEPRFITGFYFGAFIPIKIAKSVLIADNNIELAFQYFNTTPEALNFTKQVGKKRTTYTWYISNPKKIKQEENTPSAQAFIPHVIPRIKSYTFNNVETKILSNLTDLHNWYYELIKDVNQEPSATLVQIVDSLTSELTNEEEKVKAIYYWVQNNIKYIAMEAGLGGFVPEEATEVCNNKYGDCKGMASITNKMLEIAKIKSHLTWIGSRDIIYKYNKVPTPIVDNHMICTYIHNGKYYFLDATGSEVPLTLPTSFIQGKEALISLGKGKYEVHQVPIVDKNTNIETDTTWFTVTELGEVKGKSNYTSEGLNSIYVRRVLKGRTHDELKKYISGHHSKGNNKFFVDTFTVKNIENKDLPINISFGFTIEDYVTKNENEMYVNLHFDKFFENKKIDESRKHAIEIDFKSILKNVTILEVPKGYFIAYIPENDSLTEDLFGYKIKYTTISDTKLMLYFEVYEDYLILEPKDFERWNKMIKGLKNKYSETIILKKI